MDKRKKLALSDSVVGQLKTLAQTFKERNAPVITMYDSVRRQIRMQEGLDLSGATPALQMEVQQNQLGMRNLLGQLRAQREKDIQETLALIPEALRKEAEQLIADQTKEMDELLPRSRGAPPPER